MRHDIIQALYYPRRLMRDNVELEECSHSGNYREDDTHCTDCSYSLECTWLFSNDENVSLEDKTLTELKEALEYCHGYVDARTTEWGHDNNRCTCEACGWLRDAGRIMDNWQ